MVLEGKDDLNSTFVRTFDQYGSLFFYHMIQLIHKLSERTYYTIGYHTMG